ncbi:hypothetical protein IEO70_03395 [Bacillus sp. AGMB 02131]|uniref:Squalene cyclase C-terminal domain-containing protein n=1 Tax=Peribacillus faecalis TaxID=2772559 RepID=A0A927CY05_9BACI|nr:prenyltransferase/squalene oxidase repeat-containing protein [Peribacillus faecalis]MBD3107399.1 hypothetical protein [Peribacillus faecalis]
MKMATRKIKWITSILSILLMLTIFPLTSKAEEVETEKLLDLIEGIINWKKESVGLETGDYLLSNVFLKNAGDTTGDWYPIGLGRIGYNDDYEAYLAVIDDVVSERYKGKNELDETKATEWHRISLAILSMGGDPTQIGEDKEGNNINLIADGTYNRGLKASLGAQGMNGWIWGLITLDSMRYSIPANAYYDRDTIIEAILRLQLPDGGFSFYNDQTEPDMTGMALQALAPYYNSEQSYTYEQKNTRKTVTKTVRQVVNEALEALSTLQLSDGDFESWGEENAESTAQVMVALTALGIDPLKDKRFIKKGNTLLDGILKYKMKDGGFVHSKTYNPENPTSLPDESNSMASEQVLYALISLYRFEEGYRSLYDFRPEIDSELREQIETIKQSIDNLPDKLSKKNTNQINEIFESFLQIPASERSYVYNYHRLSDAMKTVGIENTSPFISSEMAVTENGNGTVTPLFNGAYIMEEKDFSENDEAKVNSLPEELTTEYYVEVVKLLDKLENAENQNEYSHVLTDLKEKKTRLDKINKEIKALNKDIVEKLYPFSDLSIKDKEVVEEIFNRFEQLSAYDQQQILNNEDVKKSKTQIDNLIRARNITIVLGALALVLAGGIIWRMRQRKAKRKLEWQTDYDG